MANPRIFYDNRFADNTLVASSTAAGNYAAANLVDWRAYTWWRAGVLPATLTVDCGVAKAADYALVHGHELKSVGASLEIRGSTDNFSASDVLVSSVTPTSDAPILLTWASTSYRYWRQNVTGATPPAMAIAAIGAMLEFPTGLAQGFDPLGRAINGQVNKNANGHPLGRVIDFEEWEADLMFEKVSWTWIRSTFLPAWRTHLRGNPFAFGWETALYGSEIVIAGSDMKWRTPHFSGSVADLNIKISAVVN